MLHQISYQPTAFHWRHGAAQKRPKFSNAIAKSSLADGRGIVAFAITPKKDKSLVSRRNTPSSVEPNRSILKKKAIQLGALETFWSLRPAIPLKAKPAISHHFDHCSLTLSN